MLRPGGEYAEEVGRRSLLLLRGPSQWNLTHLQTGVNSGRDPPISFLVFYSLLHHKLIDPF